MPEVNGVWLNAIPRSQKEIAAIQKKANRYCFAHRTVKACGVGAFLSLLGGAVCNSIFAYISESDARNSNISKKIFLKDCNNYPAQIITSLGGGEVSKHTDDMYMEYTYLFTLLYLIVACSAPFLADLRSYFVNKYNDYMNIIEVNTKFRIPDYEDMQCYDQIVNIDKTNIGPISCTPVEEIEQKVFYKGEIYEYYYLLTAYTTNPNGRDHAGQPYDISLFYRIDDNNIQYID